MLTTLALLASAASPRPVPNQNASLSLLVTAQEIGIEAFTEIVGAGRDADEATSKHDFHLIPGTNVTFAVHESVLKRKAHQDRLWLLQRLGNHINEYGAFSLGALDERERKIASECLSASFSPVVAERLTEKNGWVFLAPSSGMLKVTDGTKNVTIPLGKINIPKEALAKYSNTEVLFAPGESESTVHPATDPKMRSVLEEIRFKFIFPVSTLSRKKELITYATDKITAELESQDSEINQAYQDLMAKASKQFGAEVQGLSKGGLVSDLPEEMRRQIEGTLRNSYELLGFSSEDEAMRFLQTAKFSPLPLDSYFTIADKTVDSEGRTSVSIGTRPAWLHRSG